MHVVWLLLHKTRSPGGGGALGRCVSGNLCGTSYFLQKLSVAVQLGMPQPLWFVPIYPWIFNNLKMVIIIIIIIIIY